MLDTTADTMTEIAFRAGFGSVRRFNAAFSDRRPLAIELACDNARGRRKWEGQDTATNRSALLTIFGIAAARISRLKRPGRASRQRTVNGFGRDLVVQGSGNANSQQKVRSSGGEAEAAVPRFRLRPLPTLLIGGLLLLIGP